MDLATILGLLMGCALVLSAIFLGGNPRMFLDLPAALIAIGGTLAVTFIKNPLPRVFSTLTVVRKAFTTRPPQPENLIDEMVGLARLARRESLLALDKLPVEDPFLAHGLRMAVDGMEPQAIRLVLETEINELAQRHRVGQEILESMAASAPAFGMIGTLIGLAQMLTTMNDPSKIGPGMAVALLTTLYGALIANLVCLPLAEKLRNRSREEVHARRVVLQGILGIVEGDHPVAIEQKLAAFLEPRLRRGADLRAA